jgi:glycosyltransferase involved in cell wall biosynthesis
MMKSVEDINFAQAIVGEAHGGAERFFVKLAIALHETGMAQTLFIGRDKDRFVELSDAGLKVQQFDFVKGPRGWLATKSFQRALSAAQPDVVMAWMNRAARRIPAGPYRRVARFGGYYPLKYYSGFDHIICNTPDLERFCKEEGWPAEKVSTISNFGELPDTPPVRRSDFETDGDAFVILACGRLHPSKGFDTLIRAMKNVPPNAVLWLAGAGEEEAELRALAVALDIEPKIRFLGWRHDQSSLLDQSDLCVVPSRHEPLSNVVIEAWSKRVPVVATASEGPSWLLGTSGTVGALVGIDDHDALGREISRFATDEALCRSVAAAAYQKWDTGFSKTAIVQQYIRFLQAL